MNGAVANVIGAQQPVADLPLDAEVPLMRVHRLVVVSIEANIRTGGWKCAVGPRVAHGTAVDQVRDGVATRVSWPTDWRGSRSRGRYCFRTADRIPSGWGRTGAADRRTFRRRRGWSSCRHLLGPERTRCAGRTYCSRCSCNRSRTCIGDRPRRPSPTGALVKTLLWKPAA